MLLPEMSHPDFQDQCPYPTPGHEHYFQGVLKAFGSPYNHPILPNLGSLPNDITGTNQFRRHMGRPDPKGLSLVKQSDQRNVKSVVESFHK